MSSDPHGSAWFTRPLILGYVCPIKDSSERHYWDKRIRAWAWQEGWALSELYEDVDPSLSVHARPGLAALLARLGKDPQAVVVPSRDDLDLGDYDDWPALSALLRAVTSSVMVLPEDPPDPPSPGTSTRSPGRRRAT